MNPRLWMYWLNFFQENQRICINAITERPELVKMIEEQEKVDVVVSMNTCSHFLAHLLDAKIVNISPAGPYNVHQIPVGNALNPFVRPYILSPFIEPMSFVQRLANTIGALFFKFVYFWVASRYEVWQVRERFPNRLPDPYDIYDMDRTVLSLVNSNPATHSPCPIYRSTIEIGGIHCRPGKDLPPDLKTFMDSHPEGVILVSFGSTLSASQMSKEQQMIFQESFRALEMPIIWKWDSEDLEGVPKNVLIKKWLPQNDILAHPNLKVFVTHGGLLSTQEALYHGVPLVGIPLGNDQQAVMMRAEKKGFAIRLDLHTISKEKLVSAIQLALTDDKMKQSALKTHKIFVDNRLSGMAPMERGVSAINYVIENPEAAEYMKPHKDVLTMPFYQEHGYDIVLFLIIVSFLILITAWKSIKLFGKLCNGVRKDKKD